MTTLIALFLFIQPGEAQRHPLPVQARQQIARQISFNGVRLDAQGMQLIEQLEARYTVRLPDGRYWYDPVCGAAGRWGGPTETMLPVGLTLGGPLPANASGGVSATFINGRSLHPDEIRDLQALFGTVYPGRFTLDAVGNLRYENGPFLVNLFDTIRAARASSQGGTWSHSHGSAGYIPGSAFVCDGTDCSSWAP